MSDRLIYFMGVWPSDRGEVGHYGFLPGGRHIPYSAPVCPWGGPNNPILDSLVGDEMAGVFGIEPGRWRGGRPEPEHVRHHARRFLDGFEWTLVAWWDRSGDRRGASVAGFAMGGALTADEAEAYAREKFPGVFARMDNAKARSQP